LVGYITSIIVLLVADNTVLIDTLTQVGIFTVPIHITGHTLSTLFTIDTDRCLSITAAIGSNLALRTDLVNALRFLTVAMVIGRALRTGNPTHTNGRIATAPGIAVEVTALALLVDTLRGT